MKNIAMLLILTISTLSANDSFISYVLETSIEFYHYHSGKVTAIILLLIIFTLSHFYKKRKTIILGIGIPLTFVIGAVIGFSNTVFSDKCGVEYNEVNTTKLINPDNNKTDIL